MADETITTTGIAAHGAARLPSVEVDSFNVELKDGEEFLGDRASRAPSEKFSTDGGSHSANPVRIRLGRSPPKTSARKFSTPY